MLFSTSPSESAIEQYFLPPDVHAAQRETAPGRLAAFVLSAVMTAAHGANLYYFLSDTLVYALIVHIALVALAAAIARMFIRRGMEGRFFMLLIITSATASVFGAAGTALAILLHRWHSRTSLSFADWFATIFPSRPESLSETMFEAIESGRDEAVQTYSVIPFLDVMRIGSEAQKREAITRMTMRFEPGFASAFLLALQDESNTIRVQAATAISIIEHRFSERLIQLVELYRRMPQDPVVVEAIAQHYDNYAFTGILDPERERGNRELALQYFREYLKLAPRDEQARIAVGRLLLRKGEASMAADWLRDSLAQGFRSDALLGWYHEALFAARRYGELRALAAQSAQLANQFHAVNPRLADALALWATPQEVRA